MMSRAGPRFGSAETLCSPYRDTSWQPCASPSYSGSRSSAAETSRSRGDDSPMKAVVIFLVLLAAGKFGYQEYLFRAATRDASSAPTGSTRWRPAGTTPAAGPRARTPGLGKPQRRQADDRQELARRLPVADRPCPVECPLSQSLPAADGGPAPGSGRGASTTSSMRRPSSLAHVTSGAIGDVALARRLEAVHENRQCARRRACLERDIRWP